ncbi:conserved hypothetical protein [Histoplasma capsulatum H143]|uniref:Uncharacterized protein n=1 Tax=Ajellomyces capsulatus (strain H143) TaxID=544712 RepID=C6H4Z2_AJECH|nr:conserved hypothetical protein [Histoplasma capsulatum H143]
MAVEPIEILSLYTHGFGTNQRRTPATRAAQSLDAQRMDLLSVLMHYYPAGHAHDMTNKRRGYLDCDAYYSGDDLNKQVLVQAKYRGGVNAMNAGDTFAFQGSLRTTHVAGV